MKEESQKIGFARVATIEEIAQNGYVLTPGRYVGIKFEEDETPFEEKTKTYSEETIKAFKGRKGVNRKSTRLGSVVLGNLKIKIPRH